METGPCSIPAQPAQRGEETQRIERLSGLLRDAAAHPGSQRCRCGCGNGEKRQDHSDTERKGEKDQSERPYLECRAWEDGGASATPTARDWKGAASPESLEKRGRIPEKNSLPDFFARTGKSFQLNPLFVAEMMGFPPDWTVSPFLGEDRHPLKDTGTLSSPR